MLMKYTEAELKATIGREIEACLARRMPVHPAWVTHTVCRLHVAGLAFVDGQSEGVEPVDAAFWRHCGYAHTRALATKYINELSAPVEAGLRVREAFMPGFEHLQAQYVVRQNGVDVMVPTEQMTDEEIDAKAVQYERNSVTLLEHAHELRRYAEIRAIARTQAG